MKKLRLWIQIFGRYYIKQMLIFYEKYTIKADLNSKQNNTLVFSFKKSCALKYTMTTVVIGTVTCISVLYLVENKYTSMHHIAVVIMRRWKGFAKVTLFFLVIHFTWNVQFRVLFTTDLALVETKSVDTVRRLKR